MSDGVKCDDAYGLEFGLGVNQPPTFTTAKNEPQLKLVYYTIPSDVMLRHFLIDKH